MANDVVINGETYSGVESVALPNGNGNTIQFYADAVRYTEQTLTEEQKAQARANIGVTGSNDSLQNIEFVDTIEECTDKNRLYVLPDGCIYAYVPVETDSTSTFDNLLFDYTDASGDAHTGAGWKADTRLNSSGAETGQAGIECTGFIPVKFGDVIYLGNMTCSNVGTGDYPNGAYTYFAVYDGEKNKLGSVLAQYFNASNNAVLVENANSEGQGNVIQINTGNLRCTWSGHEDKHLIYENMAFFRISCEEITDESIITVNQPIKSAGSSSDYGWVNTGYKFISSAPDYVVAEAESVIDRVTAAQSDRTFTFAALTDMHYGAYGYKDGVHHACQALKYIDKRIKLDAVAVLGDYLDEEITSVDDEDIADFKSVNTVLDSLRFAPNLRLAGNHDSYEKPALTMRYTNAYSEGVVWGSVSGGYYYRDFDGYKIRVIGLNTCMLSAEQYNWFASALDLSDKEDVAEWSVLILSHHPLDWLDWVSGNPETYCFCHIVDGYKKGTSGTVSGTFGGVSGEVSYDFTRGRNAAKLIGNIHGHLHNFKVDHIHMVNPSDGNRSDVLRIATPSSCYNRENTYEGVWGEDTNYDKTKDTAKDTAFCIYCIDLDTCTIKSICYGAGYDREIEYADTDVVFRPGTISTTDGIVEGSTTDMISDEITLEGYDYVDVKLVGAENWCFAIYSIAGTGTIAPYNCDNNDFVYHGTMRCDNPLLKYVIVAKKIAGDFTAENAKNAFVITRGNFKKHLHNNALEPLSQGNNLYFTCEEPYYEHAISAKGYVGGKESSAGRSQAITRPISIGDYYGIRFTAIDTGYQYSLFSVSENGTIKDLYGLIQAPKEIILTDHSVKYVLLVDLKGSTAKWTQENMDAVPATHTIEYCYIPTFYGYSRQYTDISHLLNWEKKAVTDGEATEVTTAIMAELPRWGCFEVKLNDPNTNWFFRVFKQDKAGAWTELTDPDGCYYAYRQHANLDATSNYRYYVQVEMSDGSTIDEYSAHAIRAFTFDDVGVKHSKYNHKLHGKKIAVIGDSIVQGRMCKHGTKVNMATAKPWSHHIAEACNVEPANFGIGGARVQNNDWKSLYKTCENVSGYDVVFVCAGTNDYGGNVAETAFQSAFTHVVETLKANNTEVVVCTPVYRTNKTAANSAGLTLPGYCNIEKEIAAANGMRVLDLYTLTNTSAFKATLTDGLHPDEVGQKMIADIVLDNY